MTKTKNCQLNQWEASDPIRREDFNADNAAIDAAIAAVGNCKIITGSYVGTGTYGADNPNTLAFDFEPKLVLVFTTGDAGTRMMWVPGMNTVCTNVRAPYDYFAYSSFSEKSLSWYNDNSNLGPSKQLNSQNAIYFYLALG